MNRWPLDDLRIRTTRLTLKLADATELEALAAVGAGGVVAPGANIAFPWHVADPAVRARNVIQFHHRLIGTWTPADWRLFLAVVLTDGTVVGIQEAKAADFAVVREIFTGSWIGTAFQGRGIGTEMRVAMLAFGKAIGARRARTEALAENGPSNGVTRKLGYRPDGSYVTALNGEARVMNRYILDLETWEPATAVTIEGLAGCEDLFGR